MSALYEDPRIDLSKHCGDKTKKEKKKNEFNCPNNTWLMTSQNYRNMKIFNQIIIL